MGRSGGGGTIGSCSIGGGGGTINIIFSQKSIQFVEKPILLISYPLAYMAVFLPTR